MNINNPSCQPSTTSRTGIVRKRSEESNSENKCRRIGSSPFKNEKDSPTTKMESTVNAVTDLSNIRVEMTTAVNEAIAALRETIVSEIKKACSEAIEDNNKLLSDQIQELKIENKQLRENINEQDLRIDALEQDKRNQNLVIDGLVNITGNGYELKERTVEEVKKVLGVNIDVKDILYVAKIDKNASKIKIAFKNRAPRDEIFSKRANLKGTKIWLNEDLTSRRSKLAYTARQLVKEKRIHSTWIRDGDIFIRHLSTDKPSRVHMQSDLN